MITTMHNIFIIYIYIYIDIYMKVLGVLVIVLNATFNYISAISWLSVLLVEETGVLRENH
jgi:hypothetical protein